MLRVRIVGLLLTSLFLILTLPPAAESETIVVQPPQTISTAIVSSSPGDSILVMPGIYPQESGAAITHPLTIIGIGGASMNEVQVCYDLCHGIMFDVRATAGSVIIDGLTLTRWPMFGGEAKGVSVLGPPKVIVRNCVFWGLGGERAFRGIELLSSGDVRIENNLFLGGLVSGVYIRGIDALIRHNTFTLSPGILLDEGASATIANNLFFRSADAVVCLPRNPPPNPSFACNNMWENSRNYFGCEDPTGTNGNIAVDPLLCNPEDEDFRLLPGSPCLPENSPAGCGLIGAFGPCTVTAVDGAPAARVGLTVEPNPIMNAAEFSFVSDVASAALEIYNIQGRLMEVLIPKDRQAVWVLDASVPRGIYFARLRGAAVPEVVKFAVVR